MVQALSWTPTRYGDTYCSPACGWGCTHCAYENAIAVSNALAREMGAGWAPQVWENLGWNWAIISSCGRIKVHPSNGGYIAFLGEPGPGGRWAEHGKTAREAINAVLAAARAELARIGAILEGVSA